MGSFNQEYARYYDLLYNDKDYEKEAAYIHNLIQRFAPKAQRILELGCGSGKYTSILAKYGYDMCGLDLSSSMIDIAQKKYPQIPFKVANITDFTLDEKFDAIISFFHVMSYQCSNESLCASFANIFKHLKPKGVFLFDCWYGPAVLHEKPSVRIKRVSDGRVSIVRLAEPTLHPDENIVDVNYEIIINTPNKLTQTFNETHKMRYFFTPEIDLLARRSGFKLESSEEFLSGKKLNFNSWGGGILLKKTRMKSLLIIHPDGNIYDNHNFYEMVEFLRKSYKVTILTIAYKGGKNKHNDEFGRHIIYYFRGWRRLFKYLDSNILRYIFLNIYLFGRRKYDLIIGVDRESIIQASILSKMTKTPYALLSYEIFFEDETSAKCQNISFAIVQDELHRVHLCEQNHIPKEKVMLMPVAAGIAKPHPNTYFLHDRLHISRDKKILLYAGGIDGWSGFPALFYILESMLPDDWVFVIHFKHPGIAKSKPNFELKKVYYSEIHLPTYHDFSKLLYSADLGLVCYYPDFMDVYRGKNIGYIGLSSGKFNTYLQHGLPILAIYPSYLAKLTQQYKLGIETTDLRSINLTSFKKEEYRQNCLDFFDKFLSFETCKDELMRRIENALGGGAI